MTNAPLTFLFTDLENSTRLWDEFPGEMRPVMARHDALLKETVESHRGRIVKTTGDGLHAVFESAADAFAAALAGQQAISAESWPEAIGAMKVRMGLHTGESQERDGDFYGSSVNEAAKITGIAHGGQVLLSEVTRLMLRGQLPAEVTLRELGQHRLKGLAAPETVFQLCHPALPAEFPPLQSRSVPKHNLRVPRTSFVGRKQEMEQIMRLLGETQLLTLLGPGGTGKTRLMLQVGAKVIDDFPDGVWLVELAPLTDPDLIPKRVAAALNVQDQPGRELTDTLLDYFRRKELLLLLDNVEHMVRESAAFADLLLEHCPRLKILVTGREALFIEGETTIQIPSLSLPENGHTSHDLDALHRCEAVQLFVERARAVRPDFSLLPNNASALVEIVRRLDGIPLALELAAARLRMLSVEKIAERLNDRFRLLTGGRRTALPRQQTLQALIDWSWKLLDEHEQVLLRRLSVFSGGWSLEAAEAICGFAPLDRVDVFDGLDQLINKSLVTAAVLSEGEPRYGMLESIRQYAQDRLFEAEEGEGLRDRHAEYFVSFTEMAEDQLPTSGMMIWVGRLRQELDNMRAVVAWTLESRPEMTLRLVGILRLHQGFWMSPVEAHEWLSEAVARTRGAFEAGGSEIAPAHFIKGLIGLGAMKGMLGDSKGVRSVLDEAIPLAREHGEDRLYANAVAMSFLPNIYDPSPELFAQGEEVIRISRKNGFQGELVSALTTMGGAILLSGDLARGEPYIAEALQLAAEKGNPRDQALILVLQAYLMQFRGEEPAVFRDYVSQAMKKYQEIGDQSRVNGNRSAIAHSLRREGRFGDAVPWYQETILVWLELGQLPAVAHQLECFAYMAIAQKDFEHAARLLGRAAQTREELDEQSINPQEIAELERGLAQLTEAIGEAGRDRLMNEGRRLTLDEAVQLALET